MRDTHLRNHKNFKAHNLSLDKSMHPVDNESARHIIHNLNINKSELRDKNGNKVIKLPFAAGENDRAESFLIYKSLRDKYMTNEEKNEQAAKVTNYLRPRRYCRHCRRRTRESLLKS